MTKAQGERDQRQQQQQQPSRAAGERRQRYGWWAAPKHDEALLIWPSAAEISASVRQNAARLATAGHVRIDGVPLPELRQAARAFAGHVGTEPLIATGHQCELHHPGVWIKNAVICAAAEACGGVALHVAVDTDAPKHLKLRWPGFSAPITDDPRRHNAAWTGLLSPPTPAHLESLIEASRVAASDARASLLVGQFLGACRSFLVDQADAIAPLDLPSMLANAQHRLDWELGLHYTELTLSGLLGSGPWASFVVEMASNAREFAATYNRALAEYRREAGIDADDRPMPNLALSPQRVEIPFWLDELGLGRRHRAEVLTATGGGFSLVAPGDGSMFDLRGPGVAPGRAAALLTWLRQRRLRLSPRALSLTMYLRLLMCDLFVHGIGGGHYDQVTDRIIHDYFGIEPPSFAVTTATLFHPWAAERERVCLPCLKHEGHVLAHAALGAQKARWLARIESATGFHARRAVFEQMHDARRAALRGDDAHQQWGRRVAEAHRAASEEAELFDRELFYAVQPARRLEAMVGRVRGDFQPASA